MRALASPFHPPISLGEHGMFLCFPDQRSSSPYIYTFARASRYDRSPVIWRGQLGRLRASERAPPSRREWAPDKSPFICSGSSLSQLYTPAVRKTETENFLLPSSERKPARGGWKRGLAGGRACTRSREGGRESAREKKKSARARRQGEIDYSAILAISLSYRGS